MMEHMQRVARNPAGSLAVAQHRTPAYLSEAATKSGDGRYALEYIVSTGYWIQINGQWCKRKEVIG